MHNSDARGYDPILDNVARQVLDNVAQQAQGAMRRSPHESPTNAPRNGATAAINLGFMEEIHRQTAILRDLISENNGRLYQIVEKTIGVEPQNTQNGQVKDHTTHVGKIGGELEAISQVVAWQRNLITQLEKLA